MKTKTAPPQGQSSELTKDLAGSPATHCSRLDATPVADEAMMGGFSEVGRRQEVIPHTTAVWLERQLNQYKDKLAALMPFVLEDYYPGCSTRPNREAVENACHLLGIPSENVRCGGTAAQDSDSKKGVVGGCSPTPCSLLLSWSVQDSISWWLDYPRGLIAQMCSVSESQPIVIPCIPDSHLKALPAELLAMYQKHYPALVESLRS
jgi:hypothetical protein